MEECFTNSDGMLFVVLTCIGRGKKLTLYSIISAADYIDRAIPTLEMINDGLSRLESNGYIEILDGRVYHTEKFRRFDKQNRQRFELIIPKQLRYSKIFANMVMERPVVYKEYFTEEEYKIFRQSSRYYN